MARYRSVLTVTIKCQVLCIKMQQLTKIAY